MSARIWDPFISDEEREVYRQAGFGGSNGFKDRPALLIIDITYMFVGDRPEPILESMKRFPISCGKAGWDAIARLQPVLELARSKGVPVLYTVPGGGPGQATKSDKDVEREGSAGVPLTAVPDPIAPAGDDIVIAKPQASGFHGTPLLRYLIEREINQLLVAGCSTSGCVRASVVDAYSYGFNVAVMEDCTFDRALAPHAINLFDMHQKYADVVAAEAVKAYLSGLPRR